MKWKEFVKEKKNEVVIAKFAITTKDGI